jgi:hypothetical protein
MTKSSNSSKRIDLDRDLPTSRQDILALKLARETGMPRFADYLEFLGKFAPLSEAELRARKGPGGARPFEL